MKKFFIPFVCAIAMSAAFTSCEKAPTPDGEVSLVSISLTKALNPSLPADVAGKIDQTAKTVGFVIPTSVTETSFIPTFTVTEFDAVSVEGAAVESGVTSVKIAEGTKISVKDEISALDAEYTVSVVPNDGAAELLTLVFKGEENDLLSEDVAPEAIEEKMLVRVPGAAFQKELKLSATAGLNDIVKINGEEAGEAGVVVDTHFPIDITVTDAVAGTTATYELKVGKILNYVLSHLTTYVEGTMGSDVSMEINPVDNTPYITYVRKVDGDSYNRVSVAKFNGSAFEIVGTSGFSADVKAASRATMAFDGNGTPYVKYVGGEVASRNSVQKFNGSAWELVGEAGQLTSVNVNTTYMYPIVFEEGSNQPIVLFNGNTKATTESYRNMNYTKFNGSEWTESVFPGVPAYGSKGTSGGMYYNSAVTNSNGKVYMVSALNEYGFFVHELKGNGDFSLIINDYIPEGEQCGLPGNIGIACDSEGTPYIFEAIWSKSVMQIYKVDVEKKSLNEYATALPIAISSSGGTTHDAAFGINPVSNLVVAVVDGGEDAKSAPVFKYLDETMQWNDFDTDFADAAKSAFNVRFTKDGVGYISFSTANGIELFQIALEADILPE